MAAEIVVTAFNIIKFIYKWHGEYEGSNKAIARMMVTVGLVDGVLTALDTDSYDNFKPPLMALVDLLNNTKDILTASKQQKGKVFQFIFPGKVTEELVAIENRIHQFVSILSLAVSSTQLKLSAAGAGAAPALPVPERKPTVMDFITDEEAKMFWKENFGENAFSIEWPPLEKALKATYSAYIDADSLNDLHLRLDNLNTGYISCHRLSDFCGKESLSSRLKSYTNRTQVNAKPLVLEVPVPSAPPLPASPSQEDEEIVSFPLLLWVDDRPENNKAEVDFARKQGINVKVLKGSSEAKQWMIDHPEVLEEEDPKNLRIITDNAREGANTVLDINAGEDMIRFIRGRRCKVPILIYCGNLDFTKYTASYKEASATTKASVCRAFISELKK